MQGRVGVAPALAGLPVGVLELVLDVEEEDAGDAGEDRGRHLHQQPGGRADDPDRSRRAAGRARCWSARRCGRWRGRIFFVQNARADHQRPDRADPEHHHRAAEEPVGEASLPGRAAYSATVSVGDVALCRGGRGRPRCRGGRRGCGASWRRAGRRGGRSSARARGCRASSAGTSRGCSRGRR